MAFLSDVMNALVTAAAAAVYPDGTGNPSVAAVDVQLYAGWPVPTQLNADLATGKAHVSVFPFGRDRNTSRYPPQWVENPVPAAAVVMTQAGQVLTLSGTAAAGNIIVAEIGHSIYAYALLGSDTLVTAAAALAALMAVDYPDVAVAATVITLPAAAMVRRFRVGATGSASRPVRTAEQIIQITVWAASNTVRTTLGNAIDAALSDVERLALPDGSVARVMYHHGSPGDMLENAHVYRFDLYLKTEYTVLQTQDFTPVLAPVVLMAAQDALVGPPVPVFDFDDGSTLLLEDGVALVLK